MTFGVISFRFVQAGLVPLAAVPVVYALAMGVEAVAALATGLPFDRFGRRVLLVLPVLVAAVPPLVFARRCGRRSPGWCCGVRRPASRTPPSRR